MNSRRQATSDAIAGHRGNALTTVPLEAALQVPPRDTWDQGDILEALYFAAFDGLRPAVLVTPACDLEHDKVSLWTFVALFPDVEVARQITAREIAGWNLTPGHDGLLSVSGPQRKTLEERVGSLIAQRYGRYHWIPVAIGASPAQVADFTCVTSLPVDEVRGKAVRIASLRSSWREQLPTRYAAYLGRVGTDDFVKDGLRGHIDRLVGTLVRR